MSDQTTKRLPIWMKLALTAFVAVLVPVYLHVYGASNFLWFCDVALALSLVAVWTEHSLPASMASVGILFMQTLWCADLMAAFFGVSFLGTSAYMFDDKIPMFTRLPSLYHVWLPFLLLYMLTKLGYDRRAFWYMTTLSSAILLICYFLISPSLNVNYVFGPPDRKWMNPLAWLGTLMVGLPLICYLPTHYALKRWLKG